MRSFLDPQFRKCFEKLPKPVKIQARKVYRLWSSDHHHPSLHFKQVHLTDPVYSIRVGSKWRAMGILQDDFIIWFWIGSHERYNKLLRNL